MSSAKLRPFCLGSNALSNHSHIFFVPRRHTFDAVRRYFIGGEKDRVYVPGSNYIQKLIHLGSVQLAIFN